MSGKFRQLKARALGETKPASADAEGLRPA
jgi:hypothetical protein